MIQVDPAAALARTLGALAGVSVELERPSDERHGDYATNVALRLAGERRQPPRDVAAELAERVAALDAVAGVEVAGPGFLNLTVAGNTMSWGLMTRLGMRRREDIDYPDSRYEGDLRDTIVYSIASDAWAPAR